MGILMEGEIGDAGDKVASPVMLICCCKDCSNGNAPLHQADDLPCTWYANRLVAAITLAQLQLSKWLICLMLMHCTELILGAFRV